MKKLQHLRSVAMRIDVLNDDDVIRLGSELFRALCQIQNTIGAERELRFLELLHTGLNRVRVAMYEKGAKWAASVRRRALRAHTYMIRVGFAPSQTRRERHIQNHQCGPPEGGGSRIREPFHGNTDLGEE